MLATMKRVIAAKREEAEKNDKGFTLIELLVVVLIIGVLAAIAIPVFLSQQDGARKSALESDLATAKTAVAAYLAETPGTAATAATKTALEGKGYTVPSAYATPTVVSGDGGFTITMENTTHTGSVKANSIPVVTKK